MRTSSRITRLLKMLNCSFSEASKKETASRSGQIFIKNENLHFWDQNYVLEMSPMYPQLTQKGYLTYTINSQRIVLYFKFISKAISNDNDDQKENKDLSFSFKFAHLSSLIAVEPNSNTSAMITRRKMEDKAKIYQNLQVIDRPEKREVELIIRKSSSQNLTQILNSPIFLKFAFPYYQYKIMHILLKKSLLDLSGVRLSHEISRMEQLGELETNFFENKKALGQQTQSFYKQ